MRGKTELFTLVIGLVLFIFDLGSDIFVALQYVKHNEIWWFVTTICFAFFTMIWVSIAARYQMKKDRYSKRVVCLFLSFFRRYYKEFKQWKRTFWDQYPCEKLEKNCSWKFCKKCELFLEEKSKFKDTQYKLAAVRYIETMCESAPQWCLQVYIMLRQWHFPWYTMVSVVFSFLSLAWSITVLEKASKNSRSNKKFSPKCTALTILLWQLLNLLSRLASIVIFAYVFKGYVFAVLGLHLVLINIAITIDRKSEICFFLTIICLNFSSVFHSSEAVLRWIRIELYPTIFINNVLIAFENILMIILSVTVSKPGVTHMKIIGPTAASCALIGLVLGNIFFIVYYKFYSRTKVQPCSGSPNFNNAVVSATSSHGDVAFFIWSTHDCDVECQSMNSVQESEAGTSAFSEKEAPTLIPVKPETRDQHT